MTVAANSAEYLASLSRINRLDYQDEGTQKHLSAVAVSLDDLLTRTRTVMLSHLIAYAPEDALMLIGQERRIRRYPNEPLDTYRKRVQGAWDYWRLAGTVPGLITALEQAGYRAAVTEHFRDPDPEHWAEFSVVVGPLEKLTADTHWDSQSNWGTGRVWGFHLPAVPLASLVDLINDVKPAHARLRRLMWSPHGRFWGGGVAWGEDSPVPPKQPLWGIDTGLQGYIPGGQRSDSGPAWGESDNETIYEYEGAPDA